MVDELFHDGDGPSLSISRFCEVEDLSRSTFYRMPIKPRLHYPTPDAPRISAAARREWHERMAAEAAERDGGAK